MTKRELVMAALAGREANRVPLAVWMHSFASENSARALAAETPTNSGPGSAVDLPAGRGAQLGPGQSPSRERLHSRWDPKVGSLCTRSKPVMTANRFCYHAATEPSPNHADPSDTTSVPGVEIFEPYIVMDFGGYALGITLNQRVRAPNPIAMKQL
jgi:hypothetical protein